MSNLEWTPKELAPSRPEYEYRTTFEGLGLVVRDRPGMGTTWSVFGYLDDFHVSAGGSYGSDLSVPEAQAAAVAAARRLIELGVRGPQ